MSNDALSSRIIGWVNAALADGAELEAAYDAACGEIKRAGLIQECFETFGRRWISDLYRTAQHALRLNARGGETGESRVSSVAANNPGAILEIRYEVDGRGVWFGDCTPADLEWVAAHRSALARANAKAARIYRNIAEEVRRKKAKTVRSAFRHDLPRLARLYRGAQA